MEMDPISRQMADSANQAPADVSPEAKQVALAASEAAQTRVVAERSAQFGPAVRVDQYRLENGLTVLLAIDPRAPIFAYQSWFRVGSRDEDRHRTGLAHLFEHLMFKGTTTYPSGTFDREMERRGAQTNAATWVDWTYYQQSMAVGSVGAADAVDPAGGAAGQAAAAGGADGADNLATVIAFESDRMHNLVLDQKTFDSELEVVKNERRMAVENSVGGLLSEAMFALTFSQHSYRWPTIGSMDHLNAASLDDLRAFYRRHYAPDNATVVVCGDVDPLVALTGIAAAYAPIAPSGAQRRALPAEPVQVAPRRAAIVQPVMAPQVVIGFVAPRESEPMHAAWEMLLTLLTEGDTAPLYDALVTRLRLASEVGGYLTPFAEPGLLELHIIASGQGGVDEILDETWRILDAFAVGINERLLRKARNALLFEHYDGLRDLDGIAEALGHYQSNAGDFRRAFDAVAHYERLTVDELRDAAHRAFDYSKQNVVVAVANKSDAGRYGEQAQWLAAQEHPTT